MRITKIEDFWNSSRLWKYFFYKKKSCQWAGSTARSYICTAKYFLIFLRREVNIKEDQQRALSRMIDDFPGWSKSYKKLCKRKTMDKKLVTEKLLMTRERYLQYQTSQEYREAIKNLAEAWEEEDIQKLQRF